MNADSGLLPWWREPTRQHWAAFAAAWVGWVLDAFDFTIFLLVMPQLTKEFGVTYTSTAGSLTLTLLVRLLGGACAGWAADRWGRKLPLMLSLVWFAACDGLIAIAPSWGWVLALRTLFGFGMGAEWTAGSTLAMEQWPARSRGLASGVLQGSWAVGYLLAAVAARALVDRPGFGWRSLFVIAVLPALLALPIRALVTEASSARPSTSAPWSALVTTPGVLRNLGWAALVMAAGFGGYYALVGLYTPLVTKELGLSASVAFENVARFNVGMLVGAAVCGWAAVKWSPSRAIVAPSLLMVAALPLYVGWAPGWLGVGAFLGGALGAGSSGVTPLLLTSLFPFEVRARCVGLAYHVGAGLAAFVPLLIAGVVERQALPFSRVIAAVAAVCLALVGVAVALRPAPAT